MDTPNRPAGSDPADDSLHGTGGDPYWTESAWFPISVPERLLSGWVGVSHRPGMGWSVGGLALWDPSAHDPHDCGYLDWGQHWAFDPSWDVLDCALPNGLTLSRLGSPPGCHVSYLRDECQADLTWTATAEAVRSGSPGAAAGGSTARGGQLEQPGRLTGTISLRGEIHHVDQPSIRDRSWGPAAPAVTPRTDSPWALDERGDGFALTAVAVSHVAHDPVDGTTEGVSSGWNRADGVTRPLVSGSRRATGRGSDGRPTRVEVRGRDDLDRELVADGECVNWLRWPGRPGTVGWWCLTRWEIAGRPAWGEVREFLPLELSRRYHRALRAGARR